METNDFISKFTKLEKEIFDNKRKELDYKAAASRSLGELSDLISNASTEDVYSIKYRLYALMPLFNATLPEIPED